MRACEDILRLSAHANGEGFAAHVSLILAERWWQFAFRLSWRNAWVGVRYTDFPRPLNVRAVTLQPLPCIGVQLLWRSLP